MKALLLLICSGALALSQENEGNKPPVSYSGPGHPTINMDRPDVTSVDTMGSKWCMWYIFKGTRSEGSHGILTIDDKVVHGKAIYEKMTVSGREFIWYGSWNDRKNLFSTSGWMPADLINWVTTKAEQGGAGQPATRPESKLKGSDKPQTKSERRSR